MSNDAAIVSAAAANIQLLFLLLIPVSDLLISPVPSPQYSLPLFRGPAGDITEYSLIYGEYSVIWVLWIWEACCRLIIADIDGTKGLAGTAQSCHGICYLKLGGRLFIRTSIAFNRSQQF